MGVTLLLGVGTIVCYKVWHYYRQRRRPPTRSSLQRIRRDSCLSFHGRNRSCVYVTEDTDDQLSENPMINLQQKSGKTSLMKEQKDETDSLRHAGQITKKDLEIPSTEHSGVDMACAIQGDSVPSSPRQVESCDSQGLPRRLNQDGSFDSTCSEPSMDSSLPESKTDVDTSTMLCLEKLQKEIDQLKTNFILISEEFEKMKHNMKANVPDTSPMLTSRNQDKDDTEGEHEVDRIKEVKAQESFTELYSPTTIKPSTSSELSDSYPVVQGKTFAQESIGSAESLASDSPHTSASPTKLSTGEVESLSSSAVKEIEASEVQGKTSVQESIESAESLASDSLHPSASPTKISTGEVESLSSSAVKAIEASEEEGKTSVQESIESAESLASDSLHPSASPTKISTGEVESLSSSAVKAIEASEEEGETSVQESMESAELLASDSLHPSASPTKLSTGELESLFSSEVKEIEVSEVQGETSVQESMESAETLASDSLHPSASPTKLSTGELESLSSSAVKEIEVSEVQGKTSVQESIESAESLASDSLHPSASPTKLSTGEVESLSSSAVKAIEASEEEKEIHQLKTNCILIDEGFEKIKHNRNLPGMSGLMKTNVPDTNLMLTSRNQDKDYIEGEYEIDRIKEEEVRECFTGLYSLSTIKHSTSSQLSDSYPMLQGKTSVQESIGSAKTLASDSLHLAASPTKLSISEVESLYSSAVKEIEELLKEINQLETSCILINEKLEKIKRNRNLQGMSSLMKTNVPDTSPMLTSRNQDKDDNEGEHEVDRIKEEKAQDSVTVLYSPTTIKPSTSSELSDSYPVVEGKGFAQESIGSAESLASDSPYPSASPTKLSTGEVESLSSSAVKEIEASEMQSCFSLPDKETCMDKTDILQPDETVEIEVLSESDYEQIANIEWDENDLKYPDYNIAVEEDISIQVSTEDIHAFLDNLDQILGDEIIHCITLYSDIELKATSVDLESASGNMTSSLTASMKTERSPEMDSSGFDNGCQMVDSCTAICSSQSASDSEVSIGKKKENTDGSYKELAESVSTVESMNLLPSPSSNSESGTSPQISEDTTSEMSMPASESHLFLMPIPVPSFESSVAIMENVGQRVNIMQYAIGEWEGNTMKAATILKGYAEIPSLLGFQYLRRIRGDDCNGIIRAAIYQALTQGIPIRNGAITFQYLSQAFKNKSCEWIKKWKFSGWLPYHGSNVIHGMQVCLWNLDNAVMLLCHGNREDKLAHLLNSDAIMDMHLVEAVKLQMLHYAIQLHEMLLSGAEVPAFVILLFARTASENPKCFMKNYLSKVEKRGGLEEVEMCLLGYTLGMTIRVVRPSCHGTVAFICSYPDYNQGNHPQIFIIEEDNRHYNVPLY